MKYFMHLIKMFAVFALLCLIFPRVAYAYLDPGSGSYIFQMIIAGLLGGLLAVKLFWRNIKIFFKNLFSREKKHEKVKD